MKENLKKYLMEFTGTFFLVLTIGCAILSDTSKVMGAMGIGFVLMVMVYAGGHISGGHYNPAVSLAAALRGAMSGKQLIPFWISQILGGAAATCIIRYLCVMPAENTMAFDVPSLLIAEFLFTFALCFVVLSTATSKSVEGNSFYGFAIGGTVLAGIVAVGGMISLAAFNPAVAISLGILSLAAWQYVALTVVANLVAGVTAAYFYKFVSCDRC